MTRATAPEKRFWKGGLTFKYGRWTSDVIRFNNVTIPNYNGNNYGKSYVYICLPGFAADIFQETGKKKCPTVTNERNLLLNQNRWWKIVNNKFGKISSSGAFETISLHTLLTNSHGKGVTVDFVGSFSAKASTEDRQNITSVTRQT
jgi:hypothetical protein